MGTSGVSTMNDPSKLRKFAVVMHKGFLCTVTVAAENDEDARKAAKAHLDSQLDGMANVTDVSDIFATMQAVDLGKYEAADAVVSGTMDDDDA